MLSPQCLHLDRGESDIAGRHVAVYGWWPLQDNSFFRQTFLSPAWHLLTERKARPTTGNGSILLDVAYCSRVVGSDFETMRQQDAVGKILYVKRVRTAYLARTSVKAAVCVLFFAAGSRRQLAGQLSSASKYYI